MRRYLSFFLICVMMTTGTSTAYAEEKNAEKPTVDATGAILMDFKTGRVMWEKNSHKPMAMASTTKIMTAIITLEKGDLEDTVVVSRRASLAPEVNMDLRQGEEIKLKYLLYALMLQSSNDAAVAIAEHVGGTVEDFCRMMTEKAAELGAVDTLFETPNGLDAGEHHSTAYDMAVITRYALGIPQFVEITNTKQVTAVSNKTTRVITNKNRLLNEFEGANGVKTGFTGKAGHCFVGAAKRGDMQLISVVLASGWGNKGKEQKWTDTKEILSYGFKNYEYQDIIKLGVEAGRMKVERSKTPELSFYYSDGFMIPLTEAEKNEIRIVEDYLESKLAPVASGEEVGVAKVYLGDTLYKEIALLTNEGAERHDLKTSLEKVIDRWLQMGTDKEVKIILPEF